MRWGGEANNQGAARRGALAGDALVLFSSPLICRLLLLLYTRLSRAATRTGCQRAPLFSLSTPMHSLFAPSKKGPRPPPRPPHFWSPPASPQSPRPGAYPCTTATYRFAASSSTPPLIGLGSVLFRFFSRAAYSPPRRPRERARFCLPPPPLLLPRSALLPSGPFLSSACHRRYSTPAPSATLCLPPLPPALPCPPLEVFRARGRPGGGGPRRKIRDS